MIKRGSKEDITDFLQTLNKLSSKKKKQINKSKQNKNIKKTSKRKATISSFDSFNKIAMLIPILTTKKSNPNAKDIDITIIGMDVYCATFHLKKAQVIAISMKNI